MIAVVETEECLADVKDVLSEDQPDDLILYLAVHPEGRVLCRIPVGHGGCDGLRKARANAAGRE